MASLPGTIRNIFLWTYARNTWQWDALCALILVFIFFTPKSWFEVSKRQSSTMHQNPAAETVFVVSETIENEGDSGKLQEHLRVLSGRADVEVVKVRRVVNNEGRTLGYQVDIR